MELRKYTPLRTKDIPTRLNLIIENISRIIVVPNTLKDYLETVNYSIAVD